MRSSFSSSILISLGIALLADPPDAAARALTFISSGSCLASPFGFDSKLQPVNSGVAWRITFNTVGSADPDGNVTEVGQSVDSASFGVGPRMHVPAANAFRETFKSTVTGPNEDGSFTLLVGTLSGTFTAGPHAGLNFTMSGFELKKWSGNSGISLYGGSGSPVIQTVELSDGTHFQRICTGMTLSAGSLQ